MMDIKLYQINLDRDDGRSFRPMQTLAMTESDPKKIKSDLYDCVFVGEVDCETLEDVFAMFNFDGIEDFIGRSMSVSDVVVVEEESGEHAAYFCDSVGFTRVDFDMELAKDYGKEITVVMLEPGKLARVETIDSSLKGLQKAVGGYIEAIYPFNEEVCIVCNEEGKLEGLPLNRAVYLEPSEIDVSYSELCKMFREAESKGESMTGYIVFSQESFRDPYSEESRTYVVSSDNKAFQAGMGGYSIFGSSLDGSDPNVRLERYMADEHGGKDGWKVERCYYKEDPKMIDIIAGPCFICDCSGENFDSLSLLQREKYLEMFKYPERFVRLDDEIVPFPYNPERNKER